MLLLELRSDADARYELVSEGDLPLKADKGCGLKDADDKRGGDDVGGGGIGIPVRVIFLNDPIPPCAEPANAVLAELL